MKTRLQILIVASVVLMASTIVNAQSAGDFRSKATGNWGDLTTWETFNGSIWEDAIGTPTSSDGAITILNGHTITVASGVSVDQVTINSGGKVTVNNVTMTIADGSDPIDFQVNGTLELTGSSGVITATGALAFSNGSTYTHNRNGGTVPTATWNTGSTCEITGVAGTSAPTGLVQSFHHFMWNNPGQTGNLSIAGTLTTINGNLTISNTGSATNQLRLSSVASNTINIGGDFIVNNTNAFVTGTATSSATLTVNIGGNILLSLGTLSMEEASGINSTFNLTGNFSMSGGTFRRGGSGTGTLKFISGSHTYTKSGGTIASNNGGPIFEVNSGGILDLSDNVINEGPFTLNSGATLKTSHASGINGNLTTTRTKTLSTSANYTYNGSSAQVTGSLLPATVNDLTIDNSSGVTNSQPVVVDGVLNLLAGVFDNSTNSVTLGGGGSVNNGGGSLSTPLPVELVSFNAAVKGKNIELNWKTATEVNNAGFEVQRSAVSNQQSAISWNKIGFVEGAGTSNAPKEYTFTDVASAAGSYSYRLKQMDRDGKFTYSGIVEAATVLTAKDYSLSQNYPNPFNPGTTFSFAMRNAELTTVKVFNLVGQEVATLFNGVAQPDQVYTMKFDAKDLSSGIYFYSLRSQTRNEVKKMMLMK